MRKPHPNARQLRIAMPQAERRLWYFIRRKQLDGLHFRRQHTIGPYIVDFVCIEARLVIELDGDQHGRGEAPARDATRDAFIAGQGFRVLRIWNNEIFENMEGVLAAIRDAVHAGRSERSATPLPPPSALPTPPPQAGEED